MSYVLFINRQKQLYNHIIKNKVSSKERRYNMGVIIVIALAVISFAFSYFEASL